VAPFVLLEFAGIGQADDVAESLQAVHILPSRTTWHLLCCWSSQAMGQADDVAESLQVIHLSILRTMWCLLCCWNMQALTQADAVAESLQAMHVSSLRRMWRLLCCWILQALGQADDVAESLQAIQAAAADYTAGAAGQRIADTFRPLITSRLANALVSVEGVQPGQETAVAQHVLAVGGVRVQQVFPWLWGGGAVAAQHLSLKGIGTGEVLSFAQSGMQVGV
jgi:hypothetical protein